MPKKPELLWVWIFSIIYVCLFERAKISEDIFAIGMSFVLNAYPLSRALYKIGRAGMNYGISTSEIRSSVVLFTLGLYYLLQNSLSQKSAALMMVSSSVVFIVCQGISQKLHADKTIRTQVLIR